MATAFLYVVGGVCLNRIGTDLLQLARLNVSLTGQLEFYSPTAAGDRQQSPLSPYLMGHRRESSSYLYSVSVLTLMVALDVAFTGLHSYQNGRAKAHHFGDISGRS